MATYDPSKEWLSGLIRESAPVNNVGDGNIAGMDANPPIKPDDTFAGCPVFDVAPETWYKARNGRKLRERYANHLDVFKLDKHVYEYCRRHTKENIVLRDRSTGMMTYYRSRTDLL